MRMRILPIYCQHFGPLVHMYQKERNQRIVAKYRSCEQALTRLAICLKYALKHQAFTGQKQSRSSTSSLTHYQLQLASDFHNFPAVYTLSSAQL